MSADTIIITILQLGRVAFEQYMRVKEGKLSEEEFVKRWGDVADRWIGSVAAWNDADPE
jgi:hypothetical protein